MATLETRGCRHNTHAKGAVQPLSQLFFQALLETGQQGSSATEDDVEVEIALEVGVAALHRLHDALHYALVLI